MRRRKWLLLLVPAALYFEGCLHTDLDLDLGSPTPASWPTPVGWPPPTGSLTPTPTGSPTPTPGVEFSRDLFTDVNGTLLESHLPDIGAAWVTATNGLVIDTDQVRNNATLIDARYRNTTVPPSANYAVNLKFRCTGDDSGTSRITLFGRADATFGSWYSLFVTCDGTGSPFNLRVCSACGGTPSSLGSTNATFNVDVDYLIRLEMNGTTISAYQDGVQLLTTTNAALPGPGFGGFQLREQGLSNLKADNWSAISMD